MSSTLFYGDFVPRKYARFDYGSIVHFSDMAPRLSCSSIPQGERVSSLPRGHYWVAAINPVNTATLDALGSPRESMLNVVVYPAVSKQGSWYRSSSKRYSFTCERSEISSYFGARLPKVALQAGFIRQAVEEMLKDAKMSDLFDPEFNYDKDFNKIIHNNLKKFKVSEDDREDMIVDVLLSVFDKSNLKKFDPKRGDFLHWVRRMLKNKALDQGKAWINREKNIVRQNEQDEMSEDEWIDRVFDEVEPPANELVEYQELLEGFWDFLKSRSKRGRLPKRMDEIFLQVIEGYSVKEMAEMGGTSDKNIYKLISLLKKGLRDYAAETQNDFLLQLLSNKYKKKSFNVKSDSGEETDEWDGIMNALHTYARASRRREPSGKVNKIERAYIPDEFESDRVLGHALDSSMNDESRDEMYQSFIHRLVSADDVVEVSPGRLIALTNKSRDMELEGEVEEY